MIERATTCLKRGRKSLTIQSRRPKQTQRCLHASFWSHAADDIELPPWWISFLHQPDANKTPIRETYHQSTQHLKSTCFEFLYPHKTVPFAHELHRRGERFHAEAKLGFSTTTRRQVSPKQNERDISDEDSDRVDIDIEAAKQGLEKREGSPDWIREYLGQAKLDDSISSDYGQINEEPESPPVEHPQNAVNSSIHLTSQSATVSRLQLASQVKNDPDQQSRQASLERISAPTVARDQQLRERTSIEDASHRNEAFAQPTGESIVDDSTEQIITGEGSSSRSPAIERWYEVSQELGEAFEAHESALTITNSIPQMQDDFRSAHLREIPIIRWQLESTLDAGTKCIALFLKHLESTVLPADRQSWTEKQWSVYLATVLIYPDRLAATRQRTGQDEDGLPAGMSAIFPLLNEALANGRAITPIRDLIMRAIAERRIDFTNALLGYCQKHKISIDEVLSDLESVGPEILVRWISGLVERIEIPRFLKRRVNLYDRIQPDREAYLDIIDMTVERFLKLELTLDVNVAAYEKVWTIFVKSKRLTDKHFAIAVDQLLSVTADEPRSLTAFIDLAYKLFNIARHRQDFQWSQDTVQLLLQRMQVIRHPQFLEVFEYHRKLFGFTSVVYRNVLSELSYFGEADRWQEVIGELVDKEQLDKYDLIHQLIIAYGKRGNLAACQKVFESIKTEYGRDPDIRSWNATLEAHMANSTMAKALDFYRQMKINGVERNVYTYMILLDGYARRGEPAQAADQIARIRAEGHDLNGRMLHGLVLSYLVNEDADSAEQLLYDTIDLDIKGSKTPSWNSVLHYHAIHGNLADMNYVHNLMGEYGIQADQATYKELMQGFAKTGNIYLVLKILRQVMPEHNVNPTVDHYNILLSAFAHRSQYDIVIKLYQAMKRKHLKPDGLSQNLMVRALTRVYGNIRAGSVDWHRVKKRALAQAEEFIRQTMLSEYGHNVVSGSPVSSKGSSSVDQAHGGMLFTGLIRQPGKSWTIDKVNKLVAQYEAFYKANYPHQTFTLSAEMLAAIASVHYSHDNLDEVIKMYHQTRELLAPQVIRTNADMNKPKWVLRSRSHQLEPMFNLYMMSMMERNEGLELAQEVFKRERDGWRFGNKVWNKYVSYLAQQGDCYLAFKYCENHLIEGFQGWPRRMRWGITPVQELSKPQSGIARYHQGRPTYETLCKLTFAYKEFQKRITFSVQRAELLAELWNIAPRTLNFITHMPRTNDSMQKSALHRMRNARDAREKTEISSSRAVLDAEDETQEDEVEEEKHLDKVL